VEKLLKGLFRTRSRDSAKTIIQRALRSTSTTIMHDMSTLSHTSHSKATTQKPQFRIPYIDQWFLERAMARIISNLSSSIVIGQASSLTAACEWTNPELIYFKNNSMTCSMDMIRSQNIIKSIFFTALGKPEI
jgi:hypothetical protein